MISFDLLRMPWVPVVRAGKRELLPLTDALFDAHETSGLALDDPLQAIAVFRQVILPLVLDALGAPRTPREWAQRWQRGRLDPEPIRRYLDRYTDRFDLFHPERPFAQVAGLRTARDETRPVSLLLPWLSSGNNVPMFSARTEADPPALSPAEAVPALLSTHCFDTAAIKSGAADDPQAKAGKTTGNPTGPVGQLGAVVPIGATLAETIMLNTPILPQGLRPDDRPQWRAEPATSQWRQRGALGLLDLLTWQARRVRLVVDDTDGEPVIRRVVLAAGDRLAQTPIDVEPHTAWRRVDKPAHGQPPQRPVRHQPGRAAWRGMAALLATDEPTSDKLSSSGLLTQLAELRAEEHLPLDAAVQVLTVGVVYGNQSAVVEDVLTDLIPLPVMALASNSAMRAALLEVVSQADALRAAGNRLDDDLRRASGGERLDTGKGQHVGDTLIHDLNPVVRRLLAGLQCSPHMIDDAMAAWQHAARRRARAVAEPALDAAPPTAFLGRHDEKNDRIVHQVSTAHARYQAAIRRVLGDPAPTPTDTALTSTGASS